MPHRTPSDSDSDSGRTCGGAARRDRTILRRSADGAARKADKARAFLPGLLIVATAISILANVAHAWLKAADGIQIGAALVALVPPVFLLVQTHLVFKLIKARRFGLDFGVSLVLTVVIGFLRSICAMRRLATWWSCWVRHRIVRVSGRC